MLLHVMLPSNFWVEVSRRAAGMAAITEVLWEHSPVCPSTLLARGESHPCSYCLTVSQRECEPHGEIPTSNQSLV